MWSVVMLSPTFSTALPVTLSGSAPAMGRGLMLGPRTTSTVSIRGSSMGGRMRLSFMRKLSGRSILTYSPRVRGSVNTPAMAEAAAVSGLTRYTCASAVPVRPSKLRLKVRRDTPAELGDWPMPMQGPQAHSKILAPADIMSARAPFAASIWYTCLEPQPMVRLTSGWTVLPLSTAATRIMSRYDELVQEPMQTWSILMPESSDTGFTASGLWGQAARGSKLERSTVITSSYSASGSEESSTHWSSRPWARRNCRVMSSEGNTEVVAPSSAPILVMVARSGTVRVFTPSPAYSIIFPTPPLTLIFRRTSRITSLALTQGESWPESSTFVIEGILIWYSPPPMATATSMPPAPKASIPMPPPVGVWLSEPIRVLPGAPKRSRCSWWQMPLPGREK